MRASTALLAAAALAAAIPAPLPGASPWASHAHLGRVTPAARRDALFKRAGRR